MNLARLRDQLKVHEGFRSKPYEDTVGVLTIGYGRNLTLGISESEAEVLLSNDIKRAYASAVRLVGQDKFGSLCDERQEVLVNMAFNLGETRLRKFRHFLAALTVEDYECAASEMLRSRWAQQVGKRAAELADVMRKGMY